MNPIRRLLPFIKPYWTMALLSMALLFTVVMMDLAIPRLIQRIIDRGILHPNPPVVLWTALAMVGISLLSAVFALINNHFSIKVGESTARDLREALFCKIQSFSHANLDHFTTGQLMVRLTSDTAAVKRMVQVMLRIGTRAPLMMTGSLILMYRTSRAMAFKILPLVLVLGLIVVFFSFKMEPIFRFVQQKLDWMNTVLQENIAGVRVVKAFVRADHECRRFETANEAYVASTIRAMRFMTSLWPLSTVIINFGVVVVIWAGGMRVAAGQMTQGQIVAFINYLMITLGPLTIMAMLANIHAIGVASMRRIAEVLETEPEVKRPPAPVALPENTPGRLIFENVSLHYNGRSSEPVLQNIQLIIEPGRVVAFLGATGAGKTSLVNLAPRFYDPTAGRVLLDGYDLASWTRNC